MTGAARLLSVSSQLSGRHQQPFVPSVLESWKQQSGTQPLKNLGRAKAPSAIGIRRRNFDSLGVHYVRFLT